MQRAQHSKRRNAASGALMRPRNLELLRYTAPVGLISHGLTLVYDRGVPTRECRPLLYLLYYHKADVTSQTRARC